MASWKRFDQTDTAALIELYQNDDEVPSDKDDAFLALCFRFRKDLLNKCEIICKRRGYDKDTAYQIVERTLKKYGKSRKFDLSKGNQSSVEDCFKVYLYRIASNVLNDFYVEEKKRMNGQLYDGTETLITKLPEIDTDALTPENKIIHEALSGLSFKHQVIYLTYKMHEVDGVNLPSKLRAELRNYLGGISQSTVRAYKKEATDKIEEAKLIIKKLSASHG